MDNNEKFFVAYDIIEEKSILPLGKRKDYGDKMLNETDFFDDDIPPDIDDDIPEDVDD